jgi:hypothetical protein
MELFFQKKYLIVKIVQNQDKVEQIIFSDVGNIIISNIKGIEKKKMKKIAVLFVNLFFIWPPI